MISLWRALWAAVEPTSRSRTELGLQAWLHFSHQHHRQM
jgi:hypothetical protein